MNNHGLRQIIRDRIYRLNGKEFQQLCWDVLIKVYPDLQTPRMVHDLGNDVYTVASSTFFACYAPESHEYDSKETIGKIEDDYKKFTDNWKTKYGFQNWVFLTKDNLIGSPHQKFVELNSNSDGILKSNWGVEQLIDRVMNLDETTIKTLFDIEDTVQIHQLNDGVGIVNNGECHIGKQAQTINEYHVYGQMEEDENTAVDEVFSYVLSQLPQTPVLTPSDDRQIKVKAKIALNFTDESEQSEVSQYFTAAYTRTSLIESRLQALDPTTQSDIQLHVLQKFNEFKRNSQSSIEILHKLFSFFTPKKRERNSTFAAVVRAFVLLYFEDCTIFDKG